MNPAQEAARILERLLAKTQRKGFIALQDIPEEAWRWYTTYRRQGLRALEVEAANAVQEAEQAVRNAQESKKKMKELIRQLDAETGLCTGWDESDGPPEEIDLTPGAIRAYPKK